MLYFSGGTLGLNENVKIVGAIV